MTNPKSPSPDANTQVVGEEALKAAWSIGRKSWCPASILDDHERTERDWQKARARIAAALTTEGQPDGN